MELAELCRVLLGELPRLADKFNMANEWTQKAVICFCCIIYTYFRIPDPTGRSFAELDILFEQRVPARKFASTHVDVFHEHVADGVMKRFQDVKDEESTA